MVPTKTITKDEFFPHAQFGDEEEDRDKYIVHPEGSFKLAWDISAMILIFF